MANKLPSKLFAFDTEDDSKGNLLYINVYDGKRHWGCTSKESFWKFVLDNRGVYYAHNLTYDMASTRLFQHCVCSWRGGRVIEAIFLGNNTVFRDSFNLSFVALAKIGQQLGLPKLDKDFAHTTFNVDDPDDILYCERDTEIVYAYVLEVRRFVGQYGLQREKATLASNAYGIFRSHFAGYDLDEYGEDYRPWYMGGRTEAFRLGHIKPGKGKRIYYSDINSLYPYCMTKPFPIEQGSEGGSSKKTDRQVLDG